MSHLLSKLIEDNEEKIQELGSKLYELKLIDIDLQEEKENCFRLIAECKNKNLLKKIHRQKETILNKLNKNDDEIKKVLMKFIKKK